ncbi:uncharacterized protein LOC127565105 [Drosophila albomicans]|uniref:Uncharacterized protein LOC127565105 n=1 Tax=Drosophila albomicans TaxID=7291 RepID=A0A9C6WFY9_DROAB|nr:uncharacterized protein LOC127565105 [Drosophila albomicans]
MALSNFVTVSDRLVHFESRVRGPAAEDDNVQTYEIRRDRLQALWDSVETADALHRDGDNEGIQAMEAKYDHCYAVYERCLAHVKGQITQVSESTRREASAPPVYSSGCRLPSVDTEVFCGDYLRWPTFRDLFTAIYVNNPRLTPVEKLFHLNSKTADEANEIVAKFPLTNDGFASAWSALCERFENKRLLITSQLKILFNLSTVSQESGAAIKELHGTIQRCLTALDHSDIAVSSPFADCDLVFLCSSKLPKLTLSLWEQSLVDKSKIPAWQDMSTFLYERYRTLEAVEDVKQNNSQNSTAGPSRPQQSSKRINSFKARVTQRGKSCDLCSKENHPVRVCPSFLEMSVNDRMSYIKQKSLCLNCFARGHQLREYTSAHNCLTCKGRHHTLLHRGDSAHNGASSTSATLSNIQSPPNQSATNVQNYFAINAQNILLGTAVVNVCHLGTTYTTRALIDSGSEATFISERLFQRIKLPFQSVQAQVSGLNHAIAAQPQKLCHFSIGCPTKPRLHIKTSAFVIPQLADKLPSFRVPKGFLKDLPAIELADPNFYKSAQIDILIGADILPSVILSGSRPNICGSLLGQQTVFGWILTGPVSQNVSTTVSAFSTRVAIQADDQLDRLSSKVWEAEDIPSKLVSCENTTSRSRCGRSRVTLPFRKPVTTPNFYLPHHSFKPDRHRHKDE